MFRITLTPELVEQVELVLNIGAYSILAVTAFRVARFVRRIGRTSS